MKKNILRWCTLATVVVSLCLPAAASLVNPDLPLPEPMDSNTQQRWDSLISSVQNEDTIRASASELTASLNGLQSAPLTTLWNHLTSPERDVRVQCAWVIVRDYVPGANPANWEEVQGFELPDNRPRSLMVIDAIYQLWIDLPSMGEPGKLIAQELYNQFNLSSSGMKIFIEKAPLPVVQALTRLAAEKNFHLRTMKAQGFMPLAHQIQSKTITEGYAVQLRMEYLDGSGRPATNGFYAWDRPNGRIYTIKDRTVKPIILFPPKK